MKRQRLLSLLAALIITACTSTAALAATDADDDTDTRLTEAKVVEVSDMRISVIARSGVEHVIAVDSADTKVKIDGQQVSLKDLKEGDIVTIELDEQSAVKFARNINVATGSNSQLAMKARAPRK